MCLYSHRCHPTRNFPVEQEDRNDAARPARAQHAAQQADCSQSLEANVHVWKIQSRRRAAESRSEQVGPVLSSFLSDYDSHAVTLRWK